MDKSVESCLLEMELGAGRSFENMAVFELLRSANGGPEYITLREAIEKGVFSVTEVSEGGSVPELKVANKGDVAGPASRRRGVARRQAEPHPQYDDPGRTEVLDQGAGQLRRTRPLVYPAPRSSGSRGTLCTGRCARPTCAQVNESLEAERSFRSDQGEIWDKVAELACDHERRRRATGAMRTSTRPRGAISMAT